MTDEPKDKPDDRAGKPLAAEYRKAKNCPQ
jgi:hypothetical protein